MFTARPSGIIIKLNLSLRHLSMLLEQETDGAHARNRNGSRTRSGRAQEVATFLPATNGMNLLGTSFPHRSDPNGATESSCYYLRKCCGLAQSCAAALGDIWKGQSSRSKGLEVASSCILTFLACPVVKLLKNCSVNARSTYR